MAASTVAAVANGLMREVCHAPTCVRVTPASTETTTQVRHLGITEAEAQQAVAKALARHRMMA